MNQPPDMPSEIERRIDDIASDFMYDLDSSEKTLELAKAVTSFLKKELEPLFEAYGDGSFVTGDVIDIYSKIEQLQSKFQGGGK